MTCSAAAPVCLLTARAAAADVADVLRPMSIVLAPSVLKEAFGMVVLDALLHGVPVFVADAGALAEAAAGAAAAVLPVAMVHFPPASTSNAGSCAAVAPGQDATTPNVHGSSGRILAEHGKCIGTEGSAAGSSNTDSVVASWVAQQCSWGSRVYQQQQPEHEQAWAAAVCSVLSNRTAYLAASQRGRAAACEAVAGAQQQLQQLVHWVCEDVTDRACRGSCASHWLFQESMHGAASAGCCKHCRSYVYTI